MLCQVQGCPNIVGDEWSTTQAFNKSTKFNQKMSTLSVDYDTYTGLAANNVSGGDVSPLALRAQENLTTESAHYHNLNFKQ